METPFLYKREKRYEIISEKGKILSHRLHGITLFLSWIRLIESEGLPVWPGKFFSFLYFVELVRAVSLEMVGLERY